MRNRAQLLSLVALCAVLATSAQAAFETVFEEDFSTDPGLLVCDDYIPAIEECFCYCYTPDPGIYRVRLSETVDHEDKFVCSETFQMVGGSFQLSLDLNVVSSSSGMPIGMQLVHSGNGEVGTSVSFAGDHDPVLRFSDGAASLYTNEVGYGSWYHVVLSYRAYTSTADIRLFDRATGDQIAEFSEVGFDPGQFDMVRLGWITGVGDGTSSEMLYDNVKIVTLPENWVLTELYDLDPGYEVCLGYEAEEGEEFAWDAESGLYRVRINETVDSADKYACTEYPLVDSQNWYQIDLDVNFWNSSSGMPIGVKFTDHGDVQDILSVSYAGTHNQLLRVSDGVGNVYTVVVDLQRWYHVSVVHVTSGLADITVHDLESVSIVAQWTGVLFTPPDFDGLAVGWVTGNGDGNGAEILVDNVCVQSLPFEPSSVDGPIDVESIGLVSQIASRPNPGRDPVISFRLGHDVSDAELSVYDVQGREVVHLELGPLAGGVHEVDWHALEGRRLSSGTYLYRIVADGSVSSTHRVSLIQ